MIQSRKIRYFLAAANHLHFSAAAAELHISQPALSRSIRQLEERLGVSLFERAAKGVVLTRYGELLARRVRQMELEAEHTLAELEAVKTGSGGTLHIGAGPVWLKTYLPSVIHSMQRQYPDLQIDLMAGVIDSLLPALLHGKIDVLCGDLDFSDHPEVVTQQLTTVQFAIIAGKGHPLTSKEVVTAEDLLEFPWITTRGHYSLRNRFGAFFAAQSLAPPKTAILISPSIDTFPYLREGNYIATLPADMLPIAEKYECVQLPVATKFLEARHGVAYRRTEAIESSISTFISFLKDRFENDAMKARGGRTSVTLVQPDSLTAGKAV